MKVEKALVHLIDIFHIDCRSYSVREGSTRRHSKLVVEILSISDSLRYIVGGGITNTN